MRQNCPSGTARSVPGNGHSYRERRLYMPTENPSNENTALLSLAIPAKLACYRFCASCFGSSCRYSVVFTLLARNSHRHTNSCSNSYRWGSSSH